MAQLLKIVFYAINGTGLGHITRLNTIATDAAWLCRQLDIEPRFEFLTTSDAPSVVSDFPVTKLPSKTTIKALGLPVKTSTAKIKAQIINMLNGANADCLVLDTNPKGAYSEFSFLRGLVKNTVFIDRARKREGIDPITQKHIALYDRVICPESAPEQASLLFHPNLDFVGKITGFKPEQALTQSTVRNYFGMRGNQSLVYLSSGGGGDPMSEQALTQWLQALRQSDPNALIVIGYGPLYQAAMHYADRNVIPYTRTDISRYFAGFDYAVSAAGYNTFEELKAAGVPTLFYSLSKGFDDQQARIHAAMQQGLCLLADEQTPRLQALQQLSRQHGAIAAKLQRQPLEAGSILAAQNLVMTACSKKRDALSAANMAEVVQRLMAQRTQCHQQLRDGPRPAA